MQTAAQTAQALLAAGVARLRAAGIDGAARDARWLLAYALGIAPERVTLVLPDPVSAAQAAGFERAIGARAQHQPVAQIMGQRLFWGRAFQITPDVLDPRPETETLIAAALERDFGTILDLGTGSGAIVWTLLAERSGACGLAVDLSPKALDVARTNAAALGLAGRVDFRLSNWWEAVTGSFDLIVSNPPYIAAPDYSALPPDLRLWEPRMALVPDACDGTGLAAYRAIIAQAPAFLRPSGWLMVEIGLGQGPEVQALMEQAGLNGAHILPDLTGRGRVVAAQARARA
ncbi:MAG: peptide chain release factor N(5)-glutamine methyltransferase [Roseinatronobacter sp.]|nr:peptide chain release factor N(5)-glutamine methyltransferase [Roseinatronobacter sp.]